MPQGVALRALATLGAAMALLLLGMWLGFELAHTQADAAAKRSADARLVQLQRDLQAGQADTEALREQLRLQATYATRLDERARHAAPLAVVRPAITTADAGAACAPWPVLPLSTEAAAPAASAPAAQHPRVVLSLAAVSLWDSALAGADVGAGACRADDPGSEACAAESGLALEDAWANHRTNAASCAADRARLDALISHLKKRYQQ